MTFYYLNDSSDTRLETIVAEGHQHALGERHFYVLEIGTGWGGFAIHAARTCGCEITTTTISRQQYDYARAKIRSAGLSRRIHMWDYYLSYCEGGFLERYIGDVQMVFAKPLNRRELILAPL